jgi:hypothetical protein
MPGSVTFMAFADERSDASCIGGTRRGQPSGVASSPSVRPARSV